MHEFPINYPDEFTFVRGSSVISHPSVMDSYSDKIKVLPKEIEQVMSLMTPIDIRNKSEHARQIISPESFPTFDALLSSREKIRNLQLVPIRPPEVQREYECMGRETFLGIIENHYLGKSPISLVKEMYPSAAPLDVSQRVVWIKDEVTPDYSIAEFIARILHIVRLTPDDIILFERSRVTATPLVKAAISERRHIHFWMRQQASS